MGKAFKVTVANVAVTVGTPKEAQALLVEAGIKATLKDIMSGKHSKVELVDEKVEAPADTTEAATGEAANEVVSEEAPEAPATDESTEGQEAPEEVEEPKDSVEEEVAPPADTTPTNNDDIEYPEVGHFADVKTMKRYVKKLTDGQLKEWCELEGATYKENSHESINRMRMAMAIKAIHFPDTAPKGTSKSKSKYAQYQTEELVQMALDNDVEVTGDNGDMKILRMRAIMALRNAGIIE